MSYISHTKYYYYYFLKTTPGASGAKGDTKKDVPEVKAETYDGELNVSSWAWPKNGLERTV